MAVFLLAAAALAAWAYSTSFAGVFVLDDQPAIVENPNIRSLWPPARALSAPAEVTVSGRPMASLSLAINYALAPSDARERWAPANPGAPPEAGDPFYRNVWGYHLLNLLVHLGAGLALFGVVRRSLSAPPLEGRYGRHATLLASATSLVWLAHPLQTESVTYVVQRVESLMGLFYLLTLYCAIRAAEAIRSEGPGGAGRGAHRPGAGRWWTAGAVAACAAGMGSKEVMVSAPLMVWVWDHLFAVDHRKRWPIYAGLAATWIVLAALVASETRPQSVGFGLGWTWWSYLATQAGVIVHYLRLAAWPSPLVFDYDWPMARTAWEALPPAALLAVLAACSAAAIGRRRPAGLLGAWFFAILAPTSSVLPIATEVASEHRMYLPLAAVALGAVIGAYEGGRWLLVRVPARPPSAARAGLAASLLLVAGVTGLLAETTRARNRDYWSDQGLWLDTIAKRPQNPRARVGFAINLLAAGRFAEAEAVLRVAVGLDEHYGRAHMNLGSALAGQGKLDEGIAHLERAQALDPRLKETYGLLGEAYAGRGDGMRAAASFRRAVELMPDHPALLARAARLLAAWPGEGVRDGDTAVRLAERAVAIAGGQDLALLDTLAASRAERGDRRGALAALDEAAALASRRGDRGALAVLERRRALYGAGLKLREPWR